MDKDYPVASSLEKSPKELGFSRADLWSFAGLVALDYFLKQTDEKCTDNLQGMTCGDWSASECYQPFPPRAKTLFKTGRRDCKSISDNPKWQYLSKNKEVAPDQNGHGQKTVGYFETNFGLSGKESLALMGAHTVGGYSTFQTHTDYAWIRKLGSRRNRAFNNEYYKMMAAELYRRAQGVCQQLAV